MLAPLGEIPKEFQVPEKKPKKTATSRRPEQATKSTDDDDGREWRRQPAADQLKVKDLALTKDATDFEYKAMVEHVLFKSKSNVKAVCAELAANLKAQGWTKRAATGHPRVLDPQAEARGSHVDDFRKAGA